MRIIGLVLALVVTITAVQAAHAQSVPWPSISPSYRCDDGVSVFVLANVGTDMTAGSAWQVTTPTRLIERGIFWIASGQSSQWAYNAPHIPLTFAYVRPDNGQVVSMTQTCAGAVPQPTLTPEPTLTPVGTPVFAGQEGYQWFFPWVTP